MRTLSTPIFFVGVVSALLLTQCDQASSETKSEQKETAKLAFGGFDSQVNWGEHDELKAIFAYLRTTKPIHNIVPQPTPPASAKK